MTSNEVDEALLSKIMYCHNKDERTHMRTILLKLFSKVTVAHIIFIYIGVTIPIFLDVYFLQKITPATFSAFTSAMTLLLALIALAKVNKWLSEKISNKAFEKTEDFLTHLSEIRKHSSRLAIALKHLNLSKPMTERRYTFLRDEFIKTHQAMHDSALDLALTHDSLKIWQVRLIIKGPFHKYMNRLTTFQKASRTAVQIFELEDDIERKTKWLAHRRNLLMSWDSFRYIQNAIAQLNYDELFEHIKKRSKPRT